MLTFALGCFMLLTLIFLIADLLQLCLYPMPNNKPHLPVLKGQHTRCNSHYIFNWRRCNLNHIQQSFSEYIYSHVHCRLKSYKLYYVLFWVYCMVTEGFLKLYSFLCSWMVDHFTFLYFTLRLWYCLWTLSMMMVGCLPPTLFLHECYTRLVSKHCWLSYMLQLLYFYSV